MKPVCELEDYARSRFGDSRDFRDHSRRRVDVSENTNTKNQVERLRFQVGANNSINQLDVRLA